MSAKMLIGILVGIIIIGGGVWWLSNEPDQDASGTTGTTETVTTEDDVTPPETTTMEGTASMRELIARDEAMTCTFSFASTDGVSGDGTGYFAGDERMRMESTVTQDGETYEVDYIINDDTMYMWGNTAQGTFGMQMTLTESDAAASESDIPVGVDDDITYSCSSWSVDESLFEIPTEVEFMDMSTMMQGMQDASGITPEQMEALQERYQ